ncbi:uncharacterized protein LOC123881217 [Maniola jurtina]|uniref:uncharacterized protein LOC123881217 n=1 Tax=Maniola jurtina TaxID=191418 RepID=UPI001E68EF05|nr:uncharacterized protein LOC123881217 [Maniola jurtina]
MAHYSVLFLFTLLVSLHSSLASQNQHIQQPGTAIIEAVPTDDTVTSDERGDQGLAEDSSETCQVSENIVENPTSENQLSSEFTSLNYQAPNPDPYLRATFHKGHYYPYSAYNAYKNMYQVDPVNDSGRGRGLNYNDIWYPYTNPSFYTSVPYSNIHPVKTLAPVYARLYGKSWPIEQEWYPSQIRRQRTPNNDEDLLKQLEYDSIMKNILPTMSIPLPRDAILQSAKVPYSYAAFPHGSSDCALPILLGCTPKMTYGNMKNPVPYAQAYRKLENSKVHDHVDISDDKVAEKH